MEKDHRDLVSKSLDIESREKHGLSGHTLQIELYTSES